MTDDQVHPYFDPRLNNDRLDSVTYMMAGMGVKTEELASAMKRFGDAIGKSRDHLTRAEIDSLFGDEVEIAGIECRYCGNNSALRDRRGRCIACGGAR